jgi:hypothetical protein
MVVHIVNLLYCIEDFIWIHQPLVVLLEESFQLRFSFQIQWRNCHVRNILVVMAHEYFLNFLILFEIENTKENFFFFWRIFINTSFFYEWIYKLFEFLIYLLTMWTVLLYAKYHNYIVRSWILNNQIHVLIRAEINNLIAEFRFKFFNSFQLLFSLFFQNVWRLFLFFQTCINYWIFVCTV